MDHSSTAMTQKGGLANLAVIFAVVTLISENFQDNC